MTPVKRAPNIRRLLASPKASSASLQEPSALLMELDQRMAAALMHEKAQKALWRL
jgi:hypothetical protein